MTLRPALVLWLLAVPISANGQAPVDPLPRVSWPLIDFLVLGDSTHGVQLIAAPTLGSRQGREQVSAVSIILHPAATRRWASGVAVLVESIAKLPHPRRTPFATLALTGNVGRGWLRLTRGPDATPEAPFDLEISDSTSVDHPTERVTWSVPAAAPDLLGLLTTLDAVAERSAVDSLALSSDSTAAYLPGQLDRLPRPSDSSHVLYPEGARAGRREGRVWVEFVIDTSGVVQATSIRVLLSDGEEFSRAALDALAKSHYTPGMRRGAPVRTLVRAPFVFRISGP